MTREAGALDTWLRENAWRTDNLTGLIRAGAPARSKARLKAALLYRGWRMRVLWFPQPDGHKKQRPVWVAPGWHTRYEKGANAWQERDTPWAVAVLPAHDLTHIPARLDSPPHQVV